ncbi:MAG: hypothetical protein MHM6MM_002152 [Cercozoa sp. M6MM]
MDNNEVLQESEMNALVWRYLLESGFQHAAFVFQHESGLKDDRLERAKDRKVPPGALLGFVQRGLQSALRDARADRMREVRLVPCVLPAGFVSTCFAVCDRTHVALVGSTTGSVLVYPLSESSSQCTQLHVPQSVASPSLESAKPSTARVTALCGVNGAVVCATLSGDLLWWQSGWSNLVPLSSSAGQVHTRPVAWLQARGSSLLCLDVAGRLSVWQVARTACTLVGVTNLETDGVDVVHVAFADGDGDTDSSSTSQTDTVTLAYATARARVSVVTVSRTTAQVAAGVSVAGSDAITALYWHRRLLYVARGAHVALYDSKLRQRRSWQVMTPVTYIHACGPDTVVLQASHHLHKLQHGTGALLALSVSPPERVNGRVCSLHQCVFVRQRDAVVAFDLVRSTKSELRVKARDVAVCGDALALLLQ